MVMIDHATLYPVLGAAVTAMLASLVTYASMRFGKSGHIRTTEAEDLWREAKVIRQALAERAEALEKQMRDTTAEVTVLRQQNAELKYEVLTLRQENAALEVEVGKLRIENAALRRNMDAGLAEMSAANAAAVTERKEA